MLKVSYLITATTPSPYVTQTPSPSSQCVDKLTNCASYDATTACVDPYKQWALDNCMKYCNLCGKWFVVWFPW